ncbi:MAG: HAD-IA family hydrolase [Planctomycetota bacterium]
MNVSPKIRGVALDMDGLLFDTEKLYFDVGDEVLRKRGHRFSVELQDRMMGRVGTNAMQQMIDFHQLDDTPEQLLEESDELFMKRLHSELRPMPGLTPWMQHLATSGLPHGLATSSRRQFVDVILPTVSWRSQLQYVLTGDDVIQGKPHPEIYLRAAEAMQINPEEMLVLEDSGNGTAAAVAAGAFTVAIPSEHTTNQDFSGANLVATSLSDERLLTLIR